MPIDDYTLRQIADIAVETALRIVEEAMEATALGREFSLDPENRFKVIGRLPFIRELKQLSEEQRQDLFVYGFRSNPHAAQDAFERLLIEERDRLWGAFRDRWNAVANERPLFG